MEIEVEVVGVDAESEGMDESKHNVRLQIKEMEVKKDKTEEMIEQADSAQIIYGV